MLEKAGLSTNLSPSWKMATVRCAKNIARWWMMEHHERRRNSTRICFPGDVSMPRGLVPVAVWLGTREFAGIWRFGAGGEHFKDVEVLGAIGDSKSSALFDALSVYNVAGENTPSWRPFWYRDRFNAWASEILHLPHLPNVGRHCAATRENWCGQEGCSYPYVSTRRITADGDVGVEEREDPSPGPYVNRVCFPRWGAHLVVGEPAWEELEREIEGEEMEDERSEDEMDEEDED